MTNPIKPARLIPWEQGRIGVEIELEDGSSHAREVDASGLWRAIETAPLDKPVLLWWRPKTDNAYAEGPVIGTVSSYEEGFWFNGQTSQYQDIWHVTHWQPLPPAPQKQEGRG